jgi:hypothetical protein
VRNAKNASPDTKQEAHACKTLGSATSVRHTYHEHPLDFATIKLSAAFPTQRERAFNSPPNCNHVASFNNHPHIAPKKNRTTDRHERWCIFQEWLRNALSETRWHTDTHASAYRTLVRQCATLVALNDNQLCILAHLPHHAADTRMRYAVTIILYSVLSYDFPFAAIYVLLYSKKKQVKHVQHRCMGILHGNRSCAKNASLR